MALAFCPCAYQCDTMTPMKEQQGDRRNTTERSWEVREASESAFLHQSHLIDSTILSMR